MIGRAGRRPRRRFERRVNLRQRVTVAIAGVAGVTVVGTFGFWLLESLSLGEALYMTVMTLSTVGAYDRGLDPAGQLFAVLLIMAGMTTVTFAFFAINTWMLEGTLLEVMGERRLGRDLQNLHNHIILCGAGRIGALVAEDLRVAGVPFVVVDNDSERADEMRERGVLVVEGNAGDEDTLERAGIARADTLITVVRSDADNLYITITARSLNPDLTIVCRAEEESTVRKLKRVGADRVVAPYHLGALRIANAVLRPAVTDVIEMTAPGGHALGLQLGEVRVTDGSRLVGQTLKEAHLRQDLGIMVVAVQRPGGETEINPPADCTIEAGAMLVVIGQQKQIDRLGDWAKM